MTHLALVNRAPRYPLHVPLRYRVVGEKHWSSGSTENISRSGVLFQGEHALEVNTLIEMKVALAPTGVVKCKGSIVRKVSPSEAGISILAATIDEYRMGSRLNLQGAEEAAG